MRKNERNEFNIFNKDFNYMHLLGKNICDQYNFACDNISIIISIRLSLNDYY